MLLYSFGFIVAILVVGVFYQHFSIKRDEKRLIPSGAFVDIGDMRLHVHAKGEANPTIVFDCGHGVSLASSDWSLVQPELSKIVRTVVYDRAGMGLSQKSKKPRSTEQFVEELHSLLVNSGEKPPFILVGHSLGALTTCLFAHKYPEKVVGIVLVDGGSVDCYQQYFKPPTLFMMKSIIVISILLNKVGIFRAFGKIGLIPHVKDRKRRLSTTDSQLDEAFFYKHYSNSSMLQEAHQLTNSVEQVSAINSIGNIPLTVITAGKTEQVYKGWTESQKSLLSLSSNSTHIIIKESGHFIHIEHPEVVLNAIRDTITKSTSPQLVS